MFKNKKKLKEKLEELYLKYNRREFVHPDPLEFLYNYDKPEDREIAALFASSLAYGRVEQILKTVERIMTIMGKNPFDYICSGSKDRFGKDFEGIVHRFATGVKIAALATGASGMLSEYGSLEACFMKYMLPDAPNVHNALAQFAKELRRHGIPDGDHLIPMPEKGGASKRLHLMLRWMTRSDDVDPGGWSHLPASKLIIPLDVHMHRISGIIGLTDRKQANLKASLEITSAFAEIQPEDPVKYDFALTRLGIRRDSDIAELFE
ncbi:TIGR02757 family protein [Desulforegula conservatrix]|uniref:TIGR02757 family protein n=1 Tax=Desulforegula conservatrix TaxID=153026 RepID=UPI0003F6E314|nr:TIGR02757 family protein [Desulforegula conservatrix]